jgi:hypothetical protein
MVFHCDIISECQNKYLAFYTEYYELGAIIVFKTIWGYAQKTS